VIPRLLPFFLALSVHATDPPAILGVLEQVPAHFSGEPSSRAVRVVFQKQHNEWQPFPNSCEDRACLKTITAKFPPAVTWTLTLSGRNLGQLTASTPNDFEYYSSIGLQKITSKLPVIPSNRPLIANSQPYFKDPDAWKPSSPTPAAAASARHMFRSKFPKVSNCSTQDTNSAKPWQYRDADLKLNKSYSSNKGWSAVQIQLTGYRCDGPQDEPFLDQWFAVSPRGEPIFLGEGLSLVDSGDYANEGNSEVIFAIGRSNEGGYELFYDDFQAHAIFQFSYH
jgi:hypothetical protein